MKDFTFVTSSSPAVIEDLYQNYQKDKNSVDGEWRSFFEGFDFAVDSQQLSIKATSNGQATGTSANASDVAKELAVYSLIRGYRKRGHLLSNTNPIRPRKDRKPRIALSDYGLTDADLNTKFLSGKTIGLPNATLGEILAKAKKLYTQDVGIEYTYINDEMRCKWVEAEYEKMMDTELSIDTKKRILSKLNEGVIFEKFLHTKYIGQKRFSLEGGESTIPALDFIINEAGDSGVCEVVIGMAHRGRLNVLANTLKKTYEQIFNEFEGNIPDASTMGSGDVKYHLGFKSTIVTPKGNEVNVQLAPNPSHLEVVGPVVCGFARAKADAIYNNEYDKVLPVIIHGDAAIAGLGIVYELSQMSLLNGYNNGGTIHIVINNQIGFTTDFTDARSGDYSTSIAAMTQSPVLHVNGDDPEAVVKAAILAVKYRQEFNQDIYIDIVCYRRHGHNEGDDPSLTQPQMYEIIKKHPNPREVYNERLIARGDVDAALAKEMETQFWSDLQNRLDGIKQKTVPYQLQAPDQAWKELRFSQPSDFEKSPKTAITKKQVDKLFTGLMTMPEGFTPSKKVAKLFDEKKKVYETEKKIDWATAELMAYASLVDEGHDVRLSGQDVERGTFSHRHAVVHDEKEFTKYNRLTPFFTKKSKFHVFNSLLNEYGVLGFEYGYSSASPDALAIWEAQFGDFSNGAQTVIDQYIASAETKWHRMSGLVMLLPHGFEGQGPEHSSARMERYLDLCAEDNMYITNITTAANFFHMFRRQLALDFRKPLVNFSPKANLRLAKAYSAITEFTSGGFQETIDDAFVKDPKKVTKVLFCTGKVFYDLQEKQEKDNRQDVAIVRLEQIYPTPVTQLQALIKRYPNATWTWVQEEPLNAGAASFLKINLDIMPFNIVSRKSSASPATGYNKKHGIEQAQLIDQAFA